MHCTIRWNKFATDYPWFRKTKRQKHMRQLKLQGSRSSMMLLWQTKLSIQPIRPAESMVTGYT